jgi:hypothetical protein
MEGFLGKLSPKKGGGYQKRWFVLDANTMTLSYYKMKDARTLFNELDADRSGSLDREEVAALFKSLGWTSKQLKKDLDSALQQLDGNGDNEISFEEFNVWWSIHGGAQSEKRKAAGTIDLRTLRSMGSLGGKDICLVGHERDYQLQADSVIEAEDWCEALNGVAPEVPLTGIRPGDKPSKKEKNAALKGESAAAIAPADAAPPRNPIMASFMEEGSLGIMFTPDPYTGGPSIQRVKEGTQAERQPALVPGLVLANVGGTPCESLSYDATIDLMRTAGRPLTLIFMPPQQGELSMSETPPPVPPLLPPPPLGPPPPGPPPPPAAPPWAPPAAAQKPDPSITTRAVQAVKAANTIMLDAEPGPERKDEALLCPRRPGAVKRP